jgi:hypothetical protein
MPERAFGINTGEQGSAFAANASPWRKNAFVFSL